MEVGRWMVIFVRVRFTPQVRIARAEIEGGCRAGVLVVNGMFSVPGFPG